MTHASVWRDHFFNLGKVNLDALNKGAQHGGISGNSAMFTIGVYVFVLGDSGDPLVQGAVCGMSITVCVLCLPSQLPAAGESVKNGLSPSSHNFLFIKRRNDIILCHLRF